MGVTGAHHTLPGMPKGFGGFLHVCDLSGDEHHDEANAALICAAPEYFLAAERLVAWMDDGGNKVVLPVTLVSVVLELLQAHATAKGGG